MIRELVPVTDMELDSDVYRIDEVLARTFNMVCFAALLYIKENVNIGISYSGTPPRPFLR